MELTQNYDIGVIERIRRERAFVEGLLDEVDETLDSKEYPVAQELLRVLVLGTVGFSALSRSLSMRSETLQEILETAEPPDPAHLNAIACALKRALDVTTS